MALVVLVGAGQIGSRHLQALGALADARVAVVDPVAASRDLAARRLSETGSTLAVEYLEDLDRLEGAVDVAIVATTSAARRAAIEALLARTGVRFLVLEKVLFQRREDYAAVGALLAEHGTRAWVNCPRRMWPAYRSLRERFGPRPRVSVSATGADWGLACNAVHFFDLVTFLGGGDELQLARHLLEPGCVAAKRSGYVELKGTLLGATSTRASVALTDHPSGGPPFTVTVACDEFHYVLSEVEGRVRFAEAAGGWKWREEEFRGAFQSRLTNVVVEELLERGDCSLTPYEQSCRHHLALLSAVQAHLREAGAAPGDACPIT